MEDIQIGRDLWSAPVDCSQQVDQSTPVLPADAKRVRIVFSGDGVNGFMVWPNPFAGSSTFGVAITATNPVLTLRVEDWGPLIQQAWFAARTGASNRLFAAVSTLERVK